MVANRGSEDTPVAPALTRIESKHRSAAAPAEARVTRDRAREARSHAELLRELSELDAAVASRDLIGQAKGILMERFKLTPDQAFDLLRDRSQHLNIKLSELAEHLATTGELR
jgi:AmiR/NasT family two-component response regulator